MARLRSPGGCPWDREQNHLTLRWHAVEEVYELLDAIEAGDDHELEEELGDLLLQVVFHCQLARERGVFDFSSCSPTRYSPCRPPQASMAACAPCQYPLASMVTRGGRAVAASWGQLCCISQRRVGKNT